MEFLRQIWALTLKNLLAVLVRRWFTTPARALVLPIIFVFIISWSKNWIGYTGHYGIGSPAPIKSLPEAFADAGKTKNKFLLIDHGRKTGDIAQVVSKLASVARQSGAEVHILEDSFSIHDLCRASLLGSTACYGAVDFHYSPDYPKNNDDTNWQYTLITDAVYFSSIDVFSQDNSAQIYELPLQHAIDSAITQTHGGKGLPSKVYQFPYTTESEAQRVQYQNHLYSGEVYSYLAIAFFIGICGVCYHLTGFMALEREKGMSQLIEAMMPNRQRWQPRAVRFLSYHLAFDIIYGPSWIFIAIILREVVFTHTDFGSIIGFHILIGLSLTSFSIFASSFFRKAQLSGITVVIISIILAIAAQFGLGVSYGTFIPIIVTTVLFPPMAYINYILINAKFQDQELPMQLADYPPNLWWNITGGTIMAIVAGQIFLFAILGAIAERLIHGGYGKGRKLSHGSNKVAIRTRNFSKHYKPDSIWQKIFCCKNGSRSVTVKAVDNLSLELVAGSITVLLGANGSGKTTTLNSIAGLDTPTSGTIEVDGTGGLGLCPQKNVMWEDLTVYEHIMIFDLLKSVKRSGGKAMCQKLIADCDLDIKMNAKSKTLSGGQKRKLQLAMMFVGGSRVCCVDEASSGIDPLARRKIWDILLAERGKRSILFTTHFLDEADVISDHIAIMSKGSLKAEGSSAELKHALGNGFQVIVPQRIPFTIASRLPPTTHHDDRGRSIFEAQDSRVVASITSVLEENGIYDYHIQSPTIEDVFLSMAEEVREDSSEHIKELSNKFLESESRSAAATPRSNDGLLNLSPGKTVGVFRQMMILLRKRFVVLRSNYMSYWSALFIPCTTAGLVTLFFAGFRYPQGLPCNVAQYGGYGYGYGYGYGGYGGYGSGLAPFELSSHEFVYGPPDVITENDLFSISPHLERIIQKHESGGDGYGLPLPHSVDTFSAFKDYIKQHRVGLYTGGFFEENHKPILAWQASSDSSSSYSPLTIQNVANSIMSLQYIQASYSEFQSGFPSDAGQTLLLVIFMGLAFAVYPAILALYPTIERLRNVRALHYTNGIRSAPLWLAYIVFDFIFILIISVICVGVWASQYSGWYNLGYIFFIFLLYGLAATALSYCISLFAKSQLAAFAFTAGYQCAVMLLYYLGYLTTQAFAPGQDVDDWNNIEYFTTAIICPINSLLRALLMSLNEFSLLCRGKHKAAPGDLTVYGGPILYLIVQFIILMAFVIYWDAGGRFTLIRRAPRDIDVEQVQGKPGQAVEDQAHLDDSNDGLRVFHLSKSFGSVKAVQDITFGVRKSETFALLGPNGAGKSTLISLIRGDFRQTGHNGDIYIQNESLIRNRKARAFLGTCPQFDAIDAMSTIEHLRFYARARGVQDVNRNVNIVMDAVGLMPFRNRAAGALSGGNKRKLSLAIALVGNPAVLILDEPSSGMDAVAKRAMWKILSSLTLGRVMVLTTHSMEEADTICQRAGIMAGRMLALGTTEELRKKYSNSCYVHLVHHDAPHTSELAMDAMRHWILERLPEARVDRRTFGGQLRFSVRNGSPLFIEAPEPGTAITTGGGYQTVARAGTLFQLLEMHKVGLQVSHYSVHPATLDQVFLSVVGEHNVQEENYAS